MTIGIYRLIFNNASNLTYIGQSADIERRVKNHIANMRRGVSSAKLNATYTMYGAPTYDILETCEEEELDTYEEYYIKKLDTVNNGLNSVNYAVENPGLCGHKAPASLYEKQVYVSIFKECYSGNKTLREIAEMHNVKPGIVEGISGGSKHLWLKQEFPQEYALLEELRYKRPKKYKYVGVAMIHDDGTEDFVDNTTQFASKHNLDRSSLSKVLKGYGKSIKGWRLK